MSDELCIGGFVTFDISGKKFEAVLTREIKMTNKEKYIPKVGENFKYKTNNCATWMTANTAVLVTPLEVVWLDDEGLTQFARIKYVEFKSALTKADGEREKLIETISKYHFSCIGRVNEIQNAGFTIPKKVKRSEIFSIVDCCWFCPDALTDDICKLLGDLVEYEA